MIDGPTGPSRPGAKNGAPEQPTRNGRAVDQLAPGVAQRFEAALQAGDAGLAERVADDALRAGLDAPTIHSHVIAPAMRRIGELWEQGVCSIADEHLASAVCEHVLARVFPQFFTGLPRSRERVLLAATQGEHHVLGLRMAADVLEGVGFDVLYLGADVPLDDLLDSCRRHRPAVVGLSVAMPHNVPTLLRELTALAGLKHAPRLLVGGPALSDRVRAALNVPVVEQSEQIVSIVEQLLTEDPQGTPVEPALRDRVSRAVASVESGAGETGTIASRLAATVSAAADTARMASRHARVLEELAYRDPLTGLSNRRALDDRFEEFRDRLDPLALLMIDVDHFGEINQRWGHAAGDAALAAVATSIRRSIRPGDFAARYGGDEFVVLLPGAGVEQASETAERLRVRVSEETVDPTVTVSIGVAAFEDDERLSRLAVDRALYEAKAAGRDQVAVARG